MLPQLFTMTISASKFDKLVGLSWRLPLIRTTTSKKPVVLLYHGVPEFGNDSSVTLAAFELHITLMERHFEFIAPEQLQANRRRTGRLQVLLTFDDGFQNQFEGAKRVLVKHGIPAMFFVSSRHSSPGVFLWFAYLRMLSEHFQEDGFSFRGTYFSMCSRARAASISRLTTILLNLKPHPSAMYRAIEEELPDMRGIVDQEVIKDRYQGMSAAQVAELSRESQFTIGCHTVDHPCLTRCTWDEGLRQIADNKKWLELVTNRRCTSIAYPLGEYDCQTLEQCRELAFDHGFAIAPKLQLVPSLEIARVGIYSTSHEFLGCKVQWGHLMRKARLPVG